MVRDGQVSKQRNAKREEGEGEEKEKEMMKSAPPVV